MQLAAGPDETSPDKLHIRNDKARSLRVFGGNRLSLAAIGRHWSQSAAAPLGLKLARRATMGGDFVGSIPFVACGRAYCRFLSLSASKTGQSGFATLRRFDGNFPLAALRGRARVRGVIRKQRRKRRKRRKVDWFTSLPSD